MKRMIGLFSVAAMLIAATVSDGATAEKRQQAKCKASCEKDYYQCTNGDGYGGMSCDMGGSKYCDQCSDKFAACEKACTQDPSVKDKDADKPAKN